MANFKEGTQLFLQSLQENPFVFLVLLSITLFFNLRNIRSREKTALENSAGLEVIPQVKNAVPLKLIGVLPHLWPPSRVFSTAQVWFDQMGEIFRVEGLGQDFVLPNSGPTLQAFLKSADFGHIHKCPIIYARMKPFINNGVLVSDGPFWQKQRKILLRSQSYQNLRGYMEMLNRHSGRMVKCLEERFEDGKAHTIVDIINVTFLDVINEMITGKFLDNPEEMHQYHKNFSFWKDTIPYRALNPLLLIEPLWRFHSRYQKHEASCKHLSDFACRRIHETKAERANVTASPAMKSPFRSVTDELLEAGVDEKQIVDEINTMMFGGHETGATAIHCLCLALALNPEVQQKASTEVDEHFANMSSSLNGQITFEAAQSGLKYLERVILEGLRLIPPVFLVMRTLLTPFKFEHNGKTVVIPSGTNCIISPFTIQRQERCYPDPLKFDPDRFLPEEIEKRHPYIYIPFLAGPRGCIGQKFAMLEMKVVMAYILRHFEMNTTDKMEDVTWLPYTTTTPEKDFNFQFKKRSL